MGFDQNDPGPIVVPAKRTTKVNICLAVGVVTFLAIGFAAMTVFEHIHR
jgi:hypothetical protein